MHYIKCVKQLWKPPSLSAIPLPPFATNSKLHTLEVVVVVMLCVCVWGGAEGVESSSRSHLMV